MTAEPLLVERTDGVVTLTLNRPDALNAFDLSLKRALLEALASVEADPKCRAVVLAGAGRAFCVGQDLKEHVEALAHREAPLDTVVEHFNPLVVRLARLGRPAADTGASWTLPRLVGHAKATEMLMLAEPVRAEEAARIGLLTRLVEADDGVLPAAHELAARLAAGPTVAYGQIKRQLVTGQAGTLDDALALEADAQRLCGETADHRNATAAFVAKQKPTFTGV
jgi:2-(1,2-epoxy-1,2-dihydrophenyl)acetyl-CoA isomerase